MIDGKIENLKRLFTASCAFMDGIATLAAGESVTFEGTIGNSSLLLAAALAESSGKLVIALLPNIGDVEKAADDLALFTDAPIFTYPLLPLALAASDETEIFLSEDRIYGQRLRVLKELEKRSRAPFASQNVSSNAHSNEDSDSKKRSQSPISAFLKAKRASVSDSSVSQNLADSANLTPSPQHSDPMILLTSLPALRQAVPTREEMAANSFLLERGKEYDRDALLKWLLSGGFHAMSAVELPGEYSVRGGILDIYAIDWEKPVRIEFFGDEIDSIRPFDVKTQRSEGEIDSILLTRLRSVSGAHGHFADYLPVATLPLLCETGQILHQAMKLDGYFAADAKKSSDPSQTAEDSQNCSSSENAENIVGLKTVKDSKKSAKNDSCLFSVAETLNALYAFPTAHAVAVSSGDELSSQTIALPFRSIERFTGDLPSVRDSLDRVTAGTQIAVVCRTEAEIRRIADSFRASKPSERGEIAYLTGTMGQGFEWSEGPFILIGTEELFGRLNVRKVQARALTKTIDSFIDLSPGDLVIHVGHGLARFRGLKTITKGQQEEEHLELEFADNVSLFVPASKIGLVQKYIGTAHSQPRLAKLGGKSWAKQKKEVQEAVFDLAMEMLELQAQREALHGIEYPPDSDWQRDFDESFPFEETEDQLLAIEAIKADMERSRPMDRLLCGDVGFGKTEVAIRAAFKAVDAGYQAAVLVPTTVLAEQHFRVFSERMAPFPIRLGVLSRWTGKKEIAQTIEKIKAGEIDIAIGTHRLVQKDIQFKNLGLVIIDEEQRFGVKDKDHLKKLRSLVDVLTMTATPIPRTLHFSLLGIRDISNLQTPPSDRLPIETKIVRYNKETIRKGILYELSRGGQVYFLHNRVNDIEEVAMQLREIVPEARIGIGHAQMADGELEEVMRQFLHHQFDVLLSTTIIESGLDIPNANTIFIDHADKFGLAELHQLRGRVGRYKSQAYCYLLLSKKAVMTTDSMKRLRAIEEYSHLGAGFQLALRDLEIRGAGNILGTQQSGHINLVGYEMYCDFLESAVHLLKKEPQRVKMEVEIDLPGTASFPKSYIPDQRTKIDLYRRLTRAASVEDCAAIRQEIQDRFGRPPIEAERLVRCAQIRVLAWKHSIRSVQVTSSPEGIYIGMKYMSPELLQTLKAKLAPKRISLRVTDSRWAYIPIPKVFFDENGAIDPDHLQEYLLKALSVE